MQDVDLKKAMEAAKRQQTLVLGQALGLILDHFERERDTMQLTKKVLGARVSFPLAGGWEITGPWRTPASELD